MNSEDIKAERIALLDLQTDLNSICRKCEEAVGRYSNEPCAGCPTFEQLNGIGDRLLELTRIERAQQSKPINLGISHNRKRGDGVLNIEKFVWLRKDGLSFTEIAHKLGVTVQYVSQFKTKYEKEIQAYLDKNGIALKEDGGKMAAVTPEQFVKFKHEEKLTQKQMADRLGVTQSTISMWKSKNIAKIKECEKMYFSKKKANSNVTTEEIVEQVKEDTGANEEEIVETLENLAEGEKEEILDQEEDATKKKGSKEARRLEEISHTFKPEDSFDSFIYALKRMSDIKNNKNNINPAHYQQGGIETFDYMQAKLTSHELDGYLKGNIIKYVSRERLKNGTEDLKKAQWYLDKLVEIRAED